MDIDSNFESKAVNKKNLRLKVIGILALFFSLYQIYTAIYGAFEPLIHRPIHLAFALGMVFLIFPARKKGKIHFYDILLSLSSVGLGLYSVINYNRLIWSVGKFEFIDIVLSVIGILLLLEACRRVVGLPLLIVVSAFILYGLFGYLFPGFLVHKGYTIERIATHLYLTTEGIMGIPLGASATYIFLFLIFGTLLKYTGVADYFLKLSLVIAGSSIGGPAKAAVLSSAFFGSISGSSIANVMSTGSFTIPMMKKLGYRSEFAGSVEAAASTGGQLMPPIMGTAAFLMAEFLGISYWTVVKAAVIPGLLYYICVYCAVHFEAKRMGLKGMKRAELPSLKRVLQQSYMITPLITIIYLLATGMTPVRSSLYAMIVAIIVGFINPETKITLRGIVEVLKETADSALGVVIATASAGIIVGIVTLTGLGMKMGNGLVEIAGNNLVLTLIFVALTSLILGMGVPTAPNYVITSMVAAPALITMGISPLAASLFVLYFGIISDVTPPVCLSAFAASSIAKSDIMKTGIQASKTAIAGFIIPFAFVLNPSLLLIDIQYTSLIFYTLTAITGIVAVSSSFVGYFVQTCTRFERIGFFTGGILAISSGFLTSVVGIAILFSLVILQLIRKRKNLQINSELMKY